MTLKERGVFRRWQNVDNN